MHVALFNMVKRVGVLTTILFAMTCTAVLAQAPVAAFSVSLSSGCAPLSVNFSNASSGASGYQWNFGNGNFSSLANPQNVYIQPGVYQVTMVASAGGQSDTATAQITVTAGPQLNISVNSYQGCNDVTSFQFNCNSADVANLSWDFGDGTSSTELNPEKIYNDPGFYSVSLLATNTAGCQSLATLPQNIAVIEPPVASFTVNNTETCNILEEFHFTSASVNGDEFLWDFGDGLFESVEHPDHVFAGSGVFTVSLSVTNDYGCTDTYTLTDLVTVHPDHTPVITASVYSGCLPLASNLSSNVTGASSYHWTSSDGQSANTPGFSVTYFPAGIYEINLTVDMPNGCTFTSPQPTLIQVNPKPVASFVASNTIGCAPLIVDLDNTSTGATNYYWTFGDGGYSFDAEPVYAYQDAGVYSITLKAFNEFGCWRTTTIDSIVVTAPTIEAELLHHTGCPPLEIEVTNTTINAVSYLWDFGDGTYSTDSIPQHTYTELGNYTLSLIAFGSGGCSDTLIFPGGVNVTAQVANYPPPPPLAGCAPFTTSFGLNDPYIISFLWDFGDGTTSTLPNPVHTYQQPGNYTVSLQINDGSVCGLAYPQYQQITVEGLIPEFEVSIDPCPPHTVHFTDTVSDAVSWLWDFGDGATSTLQNPDHIYANTNNYHPGLTIITAAGCEQTFVGFNAVTFGNNQPSFTSSYTAGTSFPATVQFQASNVPGASSWQWDFGDGTTGSGQSVSHTYQSEGEYTVVLTVVGNGCSISVTGEAFSTPSEPPGSGTGGTEPPVTTIPAQPFISCAPASVSFFPQSPAHQVIEWDFGDGTTSNQSNPVKIYTQPGIYNVTYTALTSQGIQTITYPMSVMIGGFSAEMLVNTSSDCDNFYMETNLANAGLFDQVQWSFGGSAPQNGVQVNWQVPLTNSAINITAMTRDTLGCYSVANQNVLMDKPMPFVSYPTTVCRDAIHFQQLAGTGGLSFFWEFGDGETSNEDSPVHQYDSTGAYTVHLTITTDQGCFERHTLSPQIIFAAPPMQYEVSGTWNGCVPHELEITYPGALAFVNFSFGDSLLSNTDTVQLAFADTGVYNGLQMIATTTWISGCRDTFQFDPIHVYGAFADFEFTQDASCFPVNAQFTDLSNNAQLWNWDFGNGVTSSAEHPLITFTTTPGDSITLAMETIHGCRDTVVKEGLHIFELSPEINFSGACNPLDVAFNVFSNEPADFIWHLGNGQTENASAFTYTYTSDGVFLPFVTGLSAEGCRDTVYANIPVTVTAIEADFTSSTNAACAPSIIEYTDLTVGAVSWDWDFGDFSGSSLQNPLKLYNTPGEYTVSLTVTSLFGCSDTKTMTDFISVLGPGTSFLVEPAQAACTGSPVQFTDLSVEAVEWEWNFGEGSSTNVQNPVFTYNEPGNYIVTLFARDTLGCSAFYSIPVAYSILPRPDAQFVMEADSGCAPFTPVISNTSGGATSYTWDFGDGFVSNAINPQHTYNTHGDYAVRLIASNEFACSDTLTVNPVRSLIVPKAFLSINEVSGCIPLDVQFDNMCFDLDNPTYQLFFSDTVLETNPDSIYTFYNPGFYSVELVVTNINGCADTIYYPHAIQVFDIYPPSLSDILRVSVENSASVRLEWTQNYDPQFAYYAIFRENNQTGAYDLIETIDDSHVLVYSDFDVNVEDSVYCYKVNVVDVCGRTRELDSLVAHCTINVETITHNDNSVDVSWTPYVGRQAGQYVILRQEENSMNIEDIAVVPGDSTHYLDQSVVCPVKYTYSIKAIELDGLMHLESESDRDIAYPAANPFLHQFVHVGRSTVINNSFILTEWAAPDTLAQSTVGYAIFRSSNGTDFELLDELPPTQTFYIDSLADVMHTKYEYQIFALNSCGMESGAGVKGDNIVLRVEMQTELLYKLMWTPYEGWGPGGVGFYNIEMQMPDGSWEVIKSLPGSASEYITEGF